jgi:hypothetical protein
MCRDKKKLRPVGFNGSLFCCYFVFSSFFLILSGSILKIANFLLSSYLFLPNAIWLGVSPVTIDNLKIPLFFRGLAKKSRKEN